MQYTAPGTTAPPDPGVGSSRPPKRRSPSTATRRAYRCAQALVLAAASLHAVDIASSCTSYAVLQRDKPLPIWGTGTAGERVTVRFAGQEVAATVDANGRWQVVLAALQASTEDRAMQVVGATSGTATAEHLVVGDVWLCAGQSNMEFKVRTVIDAKDEVAAASQPLIRQLDIPNVHAAQPLATVHAEWRACTPSSVGNFTAVGYFFARAVRTEVDVPIGLVEADWGGSRIEPWIPPVGIRSVPELSALTKQVDAWDVATEEGSRAWKAYVDQVRAWMPRAETAIAARGAMPDPPQAPLPRDDRQEPTRVYNAMIHPLKPMALRGVLWYQGESNGGEGASYGQKMQALVQGWRTLFADESLPFYWVQIANYQGPSDPEKPWVGDGWAPTRDAQLKALAIPHTGMAVTIDLGEASDIHPKNKQDVGKRLALWALAQDYGKSVVRSGPLYRGQAIEGSTIRISFDHIGGGLMVGDKRGLAPPVEVAGGKLTWFAIAGEDKAWRKAEARIDGDSVVVSAPGLTKPVAVRYAYAMNPQGCNLYNRDGLPASPFRTDSW